MDSPKVYTVGFLIRENKENVVIAGTLVNDGDISEVVVIPNKCILGRKVILPGSETKPNSKRKGGRCNSRSR
jgi:hypothetical protein